MTRAQRRTRARKAGQLAAEDRTFAAGLNLAENPNRRPHTARLSADTVAWLSATVAREQNRATLTQHERYRRSDGRRYPDRRELNGAPSPASYATTYGPRRDWRPS